MSSFEHDLICSVSSDFTLLYHTLSHTSLFSTLVSSLLPFISSSVLTQHGQTTRVGRFQPIATSLPLTEDHLWRLYLFQWHPGVTHPRTEESKKKEILILYGCIPGFLGVHANDQKNKNAFIGPGKAQNTQKQMYSSLLVSNVAQISICPPNDAWRSKVTVAIFYHKMEPGRWRDSVN